jgi:hypothetical protein
LVEKARFKEKARLIAKFYLQTSKNMNLSNTLLDAAYTLAKSSHTTEQHLDAKDTLQRKWSALTWHDICGAYSKARELLDAREKWGDRARDLNLSEDEGIKELADKCPGFSGEVYRDAVAHGWFLSR